MKTVQVSISFLYDGKSKTKIFEKLVGDTNELFANAIKDAEEFADRRKGEIHISRKPKSLYISFLGVKCNLIDRMYLIDAT